MATSRGDLWSDCVYHQFVVEKLLKELQKWLKEIAEEISELQKKSLKNKKRRAMVFDCLRLQPLH